MNLHSNAVTTPKARLLLCQRVLNENWRVTDAARAMGVCRATAYKWLWRYEEEGEAGLADRSSAPRRVWNRTARWLERKVERLRRKKLIAWEISKRVGLALSTVGGILRRLGLGRLSVLEPKDPVVRYERERPGDADLVRSDTRGARKTGHRPSFTPSLPFRDAPSQRAVARPSRSTAARLRGQSLASR